jgi:hypothetical protein
MERSIELRESAARCLRLSRSNLSRDDVVFLETLAAALIQDAEQSDSAEAARLAGQYTASQSAVAARATENRDVNLELDTSADRSRSGHRDDISPALIPRLREESVESLPFEPADDTFDNLRGARSVIIWALVSAAIWLPLVWWIYGRAR